MSLTTRARRIGAALRALVVAPPLERLAALLRRGRCDGEDYLRLCLELGLARRALAAASAGPAPALPLQIRLAVLAGRSDTALTLAHTLARSGQARGLSRRECALLVGLIAPLSADAALALVQTTGRDHAAEPALLLQLGEPERAAQRLQALAPQVGPQQGLLWANLQADSAVKLTGLNRSFAAYGLAPVGLREARQALAVANLDGGTVPAQSHAAPRLSVVMTCFDNAPYLDAAVRSVLQQVHRNLELIAVDDASRDDTWPRLVALAESDPRVRPVRLQRNVGTYAAKNVGLALASGEFVAFQDADDWSHPQRFSLCLAALQARPALAAVSCLYVRLQDDGLFWSGKVWPLVRWTPNAVVFRRVPVAERIGQFDEHRFGADGEFMARLQQAFGARAVLRLPQPLILAARRENSLTTAQGTGLDAGGRSQARLDYQEAWTEALLQRVLDGASLWRPAGIGTPALIADDAQAVRA